MHEAEIIELVLGLLVVVALAVTVSRRIGIPYPILLVGLGILIGLVPGMPQVDLAPDLVFLLFLPPILFAAGFFTSIRDFRANLRPILLLAVRRPPSPWVPSSRRPMPWRRPPSRSAWGCPVEQ